MALYMKSQFKKSMPASLRLGSVVQLGLGLGSGLELGLALGLGLGLGLGHGLSRLSCEFNVFCFINLTNLLNPSPNPNPNPNPKDRSC